MRKYIYATVIVVLLVIGCDDDKRTETGTAHFITKFGFDNYGAELSDYTDDGYMLVNYCSNPYDEYSLASYSPDEDIWTMIATSELRYDNACYSPDRSKIAFVSQFALYVMDSDGSNLRQLQTAAWRFYGWFDNTKLFFAGGLDKLYTVDVETEEINEILDFSEVGSTGEGGSEGYFALSPDHKHIAFSYSVHYDVHDPLMYRTVIYDMDTLDFDIFDCKMYGFNGAFSPDSTKLVFGDKKYPQYHEYRVYGINKGEFSLMYDSDALILRLPLGDWAGPFWSSDGNGIITYSYDPINCGDLLVYQITPG